MKKQLSRYALAGGLAAAIAFTMALAGCSAATQAQSQATSETEAVAVDNGAFDYAENPSEEGTKNTKSKYPAKYDLRDEGVVTSVKSQSPWGTCWAFASIAAAEISINSELKAQNPSTYTPVDLSEHHLAWFAKTHNALEGEEGYEEGDTQSGEGSYVADGVQQMNGGQHYVSTNTFASGIGPVDENQNAGMEYAGKNKTVSDDGWNYSEDDDWSLPYEDRHVASYDLYESFLLPSTYDSDGNYVQASTDAIKDQLLAGRGVQITYYADTADPAETDSEETSQFINTKTWAQYTYDASLGANHGVCIVGWDDTYSKDNFLSKVNVLDEDGNPTGETKEVEQPAGDGAWIVKNSWGAASSTFPDEYDWGNDGYFYLSYYDKTMACAEALDFYVNDFWTDQDQYLIDQYDTMEAAGVCNFSTEDPTYMANLFPVTTDCTLKSISAYTSKPGTTVRWWVMVLNDDETLDNGSVVAQGTESYPLGGFHHIDMTEDIQLEDGQRYAICESLNFDTEDGTEYALTPPYGFNEKSNPEKYSKAVVNEGESFVGEEEADGHVVWTDFTKVKDSIIENEDDPETIELDNLPIKGYLELAS